jgi:chromate transporter
MTEATQPRPDFREAVRFWTRLGFISFGGPAGQIAIMHHELVERRRWISEERFSAGLAFCTFLPGPEAQQLATYIGWSLHGVRGGLAAGILFFLPAAFLLLLLSFVRAEYGALPFIAAALYGLRPVVVAVIADAVARMARRTLPSSPAVAVALLAFAAVFLLRLPFPRIVLLAALIGMSVPSFRPNVATPAVSAASARGGQTARAARVLALGLMFWIAPWFVLCSFSEDSKLFQQLYLFFTQAALVTFGGAYAVLSYVTQAAVEQYHWLSRPEVIDGLALAEATPGPLIIVLQYVGFLAGWNEPGSLSRGLSGTLGAAVTTYATFLPSLTLVFLGAPYVDRVQSLPRLAGALRAIGAAVTGVIASLGLDYGLAVLMPGTPSASADLFALASIVVSAIALRLGASLGIVLLAGVAVGSLHHFIF